MHLTQAPVEERDSRIVLCLPCGVVAQIFRPRQAGAPEWHAGFPPGQHGKNVKRESGHVLYFLDRKFEINPGQN